MVTGVIQAGSSLGILVPPSVVLVLYGMIARQPVGQLWLAGVFPGLMMAALFILYIAVRCRCSRARPRRFRRKSATCRWGEAAPAARRLLPFCIFFLMMVLFVNGLDLAGRKLGIGALTAFLAACAQGPDDAEVFENLGAQDAGHLLHVHVDHPRGAAFGAVFDGLGAVQGDREPVHRTAGAEPWMILILMQLSFLLMGTFLDDTAMLVIVAPLYVPLVGALGFDLIWYGVLYTITCQIAYMTPPFGYNLFLMRAMAPPEITLRDIYRSIMPFVR
jgi:TRAP-type mannitol/chloroaromatic compound transport system permease large subunit